MVNLESTKISPMKTFNITLLAIVISAIAYSQDFTTSISSSALYEINSYEKYTEEGVITSDGKLIHAKDNVEVLDLNTGKIVKTFNFEGGYGKTWLDPNGRYAGNYSQNSKQIDNRWRDGVHVLDLKTNQVYTKYLEKGYWEKGTFHPNKSQMLINEYKTGEGSRVILYDFVNQKEVKTYFSSTKFSVVLMDMVFSADGSKIYAAIAPNGFTTYMNIYDTETGDVLKKVNFKYSVDKVYVVGDYVYTAGYDGNSGAPFTSKINAKTYEVEATWDHFHMNNVYPTGDMCLAIEYGTNTLSRYDLSNGEKVDLFDVSKIGTFDFAYASAFSEDGKYFFVNKSRKMMLQILQKVW